MQVCWAFSSGSTKTMNDALSQPVSVHVLRITERVLKPDRGRGSGMVRDVASDSEI